MNLVKLSSKLTVKEAIKGTQLSRVKLDIGEDQAANVVFFVVQALNNSVNCGNKMSDDQIFETTYDILSIYWNLKLEELVLCLRMARQGQFGEIKRLDQPTICGFIETYINEEKAKLIETRAADSKAVYDSEDNRRGGNVDQIFIDIKERAKKGMSVGDMTKKNKY